MSRSLLDSVVKAFAMCDPVAYLHYLECKRETERQARLTPDCGGVNLYVDHWVAVSERLGLWQDYRDAGARRHREETPA